MMDSVELIKEIDSMVRKFGHALLVIGFAKESCVVGMEFPKARRQRLDELLSKGGVPVAFISRRIVRGMETFYYGLVEELRGVEWAQQFIVAFIDRMYRSESGEVPTSIGIEKFQRLWNDEKTHENS
jgi:hypothetical protein